MILISLIVLASGCAQTTSGDYCDLSNPMYFDSKDVVVFLEQHDQQLLREIVIHNESYTALCST